jgi:hypothetical protein
MWSWKTLSYKVLGFDSAEGIVGVDRKQLGREDMRVEGLRMREKGEIIGGSSNEAI